MSAIILQDIAASSNARQRQPDNLDAQRYARRFILYNPGVREIVGLMREWGRYVSGVARADVVAAVFAHNPETFWAIGRYDRGTEGLQHPKGFVGILPLNEEGTRALFEHRLKTVEPDLDYIARQWETPTSIYFWGIHAPGPFAAGMALFSEKLKLPKFRGKPLFARTSSDDGRRLAEAFGFRPGARWQGHFREDLYSRHPDSDETSEKAAPALTIEVARTLQDIHKIIAVRSAAYIGEQGYIFDDEFDGNDFCATHLLGCIDGEPAACIRLRFFADFAKIERLAVRTEFRRSRMAFRIVRAAIEFGRRKGYTRFYGQSREDLVNFWRMFGFRTIPSSKPFEWSGLPFHEIELEVEPHPDAVGIGSGPFVIIRPEGRWDEPGIAERPNTRLASPDDPEREQCIAERLRAHHRRETRVTIDRPSRSSKPWKPKKAPQQAATRKGSGRSQSSST